MEHSKRYEIYESKINWNQQQTQQEIKDVFEESSYSKFLLKTDNHENKEVQTHIQKEWKWVK